MSALDKIPEVAKANEPGKQRNAAMAKRAAGVVGEERKAIDKLEPFPMRATALRKRLALVQLLRHQRCRPPEHRVCVGPDQLNVAGVGRDEHVEIYAWESETTLTGSVR